MKSFLLSATIVLFATSSGMSQQFMGTEPGVILTGATSRRTDAKTAKGDLVTVKVLQPAKSGKVAVSLHAEKKDKSGDFLPVPTAEGELGDSYRSTHYNGARDAVYLPAVTKDTEQTVALFLPYDAVGLKPGEYDFRYVVRLWDRNNDEVAQTALNSDRVTVKVEHEQTVITIIHAKACTFTANRGKPVPIPEYVPAEPIRFFNTTNGSWICPSEPAN